MIRKLAATFLLLCGSLAVCSAAAEGLLRLFPILLPLELRQEIQAKPEDFGVPHPYIGYLHKSLSTGVIRGSDFSAVHHTDGYGFRNAWPWPKEADIVVLGDSLVFGYGVEDGEAWPELLKQALPSTSIINLGLIGAGPENYLRVYQTFGVGLHPKLLIVGLFLENDFWDAGVFEQWLKSGAGSNYMAWRDLGRREATFNFRHPIQSSKAILRRRSYLYNLARFAYRAYKARRDIQKFHFPDGSQIHLYPAEFSGNTAGASEDKIEYQATVRAVRGICSTAQRNGTQVLFLMQPSKEEVHLPLLGRSVKDPSAALRRRLESLGAKCLDLTPAFQQQTQQGRRLFFDTDGHPNREGYRLTAEEVLAYLKSHDILPQLQEKLASGQPAKPKAWMAKEFSE